MNNLELFHGDIVYAETKDQLTVRENSIIAVENGRVSGIFGPGELPEELRSLPVTDFGRKLIIPAFSDLHVHAPQYEERGTSMDLLLSDWLNQCTFPEEAKFADPAYARKVYTMFADDLVRQGTLHAAIYATLHVPATDILMDVLEERGLDAYVGKIGMDINSPDFLCETAQSSLRDTEDWLIRHHLSADESGTAISLHCAEEWLDRHSGGRHVRPILTPRFAPTCSWELLTGLGRLAHKYHVGMQTHLVESRWEAAESVRMYPECGSDAGIYEKAGLLDEGVSLFGHVIFPTEEDVRIMREHGSFAVTCPDATTNIIAGIAPAAEEQEAGIPVAVGSDIGAGNHPAIYRQAARVVQLSKLKEFYEPYEKTGAGNRDSAPSATETPLPLPGKTIRFADAFYMATKEGGRIFGKTGSFEKGYSFDALVIDGQEDGGLRIDPARRLERFCYNGDDRNIAARYLRGKRL